MLRVPLLIALLASCAGCGYFGPGPVGRQLTPKDIAGRWNGLSCWGDKPSDLTLDLNEDRSFVLVSKAMDGTSTTVRGSWSIDDVGYLWLNSWHGFATEYWGPTKSPAGFALFGGSTDCPDPDLWAPLHWQGEVPSAEATSSDAPTTSTTSTVP